MTAGQNRIPLNLDYAASTPMRAEALLAQREYDDSELAGVNPNSLHSLGRKAAARLEVARREIAHSFGARVRPSEIILTNGGTEANQLALLGLAEGARQHDRKRNRVIVSAIEHDSILDNLPLLRAAGFTVDLVQPCRAGYIEPAVPPSVKAFSPIRGLRLIASRASAYRVGRLASSSLPKRRHSST